MTTIIGIQKEDGCMIVADSRTTDAKGRPYSHPDMKKISQVGEYLVAGSGDADACDLIQYTWEAPEVPEGVDLYRFMITEVAPSIRKCLKDAGYEIPKDDPDAGFFFLIAIRGTLFEVDESYTVMLRDDGFYGIGSGSRFALGAMMAGADWKTAMDLAIKNDIYSHPPYIVMEQFKKD